MTSEPQHQYIQDILDRPPVQKPVEEPEENETVEVKRSVGRPRKEEPKPQLGVYRLDPNIQLPKFQTTQAACFDLAYAPWGKSKYEGYNLANAKFERPIPSDTGFLYIGPFERIMVPTGLVFDIPVGYSLRIHPRSGL